ncbi:MurR/RpiR family transcriptional regulator [Oceanobacillus oncorhynchi]|uniref:MurR/RpiR family transcriptional regulator n=2 Tax=Bacillaceae TaxID=186817 RepID=UPI0031E3A968
MMENVINKLKKNIVNLTNSERKVADYIIKNSSEVSFDTINQLAKKVGTSTTTIMRFTSKLGYVGYSEFQHDLQDNLRDKASPHARLESNLKNVEEGELWAQTIDYYINQLRTLSSHVDKALLDDIVQLITQARHVYCTCVRSGLPVGQFLTQNVNRIKGNCRLMVADTSDWVDEVVSMDEDDLLIAISFPRYAKRINDFIKTAKARGVKIVTITDNYSSPIVDYADVVITCDANSLAFHNSPIAAAVAVDYIINALAIQASNRDSDRLDKVDEILKSIHYHAKD